MRSFDNRLSHFDNDGNFLHGRISFYRNGTTELAVIVDEHNVALANPQVTNNIGQTNDNVYLLDNTDYAIEFEKLLDDGTYQFQYSTVDFYDVFGINVDSKGIQVVNTIDDLRNTDPQVIAQQNGNRVVILAGYNNAGDKPSVQYVWNAGSIDSDNGGSVIKVDGISAGRWTLINSFHDGMDIRHFGVFGINEPTPDASTMAYQIAAADTYCQLIGVPLVFVSSSEYQLTYYCLNNSTVHNAIFNNSTKVYSRTGTVNAIYLAPGVEQHLSLVYNAELLLDGHYRVYGDVLKTSFSTGSGEGRVSYFPSREMIVDSAYYEEYSWTGIKVTYLVRNMAAVSFTNCEIVSDHMLNPNISLSFERCHIKESYFDSHLDVRDFEYRLSFTDCYSTIDDWQTANYYVLYCAKGGVDTLDLHNRSADAQVTFSGDITLLNARLSGEVTTEGKCNINNCTLSDLKPSGQVIAYDSDLHMQSCTLPYLQAKNCTIDTVYSNDTIKAVKADMRDTTLESAIGVGYDSRIINCTVGDIRLHASSEGLYKIDYTGNYVNGNLVLDNSDILEPTTHRFNNVVASGTKIANNIVGGTTTRHFIDKSTAYLAGQHGDYLVGGNVNTMDNNVGTWCLTLDLVCHTNEQSGSEPYFLYSNYAAYVANVPVSSLVFTFGESVSNTDRTLAIQLGKYRYVDYEVYNGNLLDLNHTFHIGVLYEAMGKVHYTQNIMKEAVTVQGADYRDGETIHIPVYVTCGR